jgi:hypothetical protein
MVRKSLKSYRNITEKCKNCDNPVYEVTYTYKRKDHKALIDGSNGRIMHV